MVLPGDLASPQKQGWCCLPTSPHPRTFGSRPPFGDPRRGLWGSAHCQRLPRTSFVSFFITGMVTRFSIPWGTVASFCQGSSCGDLGERQRRS